MRMRAGFISNSSTSSFVIFFGPPPAKKAGRGKKATTETAQPTTATTTPVASSELSPEQCLQTAVEGAMESGWLDPLLKDLYGQIDDSGLWKQYVEGEVSSESEQEEDDKEGGEEKEEVVEPQAKKSRVEGDEKNGGMKNEEEEKKKERSAREEKRWAAVRATMTEYLSTCKPIETAEYIETQSKFIRQMREQQKKRRKEKKKEKKGKRGDGANGGLSWLIGFGGDDESLSDFDTKMDIKYMQQGVTFAKRAQAKKPWCVRLKGDNEDEDVCCAALHGGLMELDSKNGKHLAVYGISHDH